MQRLAKYLAQNEVKTYTGGRISPSRLRACGLSLATHGIPIDSTYLYGQPHADLD